MPKQNILITGATGFIGRRLTEALLDNGHNITVLSRYPETAAKLGTPIKIISNLAELDKATKLDTIINLAGEPVANGFWTKAKRERILNSRQKIGQGINKLIAKLHTPPAVLIAASAIGWYGDQGDKPLSETSAPRSGFTHTICESTEAIAMRATDYGVRVACLRIGIVLGLEGGMLSNLLVPFEYGLGGPIGSGNQWISWIERDDLIGLIMHTLNNKSISGPVNAVSPNPVKNSRFTRELAKTLRRPAIFRIPAPILKLLLADFANELLLVSQKVIPQKAIEADFKFNTPHLADALEHCLRESKKGK